MISSRYKGFSNNLLIALNVFIVFLLVANGYVVVPQWLQPVGRMHPVLLHFPIVILILAMLLEFFRFRPEFENDNFYQQFTTTLLLVGAIFSAITVIMGLLLSHEPGYTNGNLQWHKWFGVCVSFIASFIYWFRDKDTYSMLMARTGSVMLVLFVVFAGHWGADITHGDNFILAPVMQKKRVPIDQALVYRDVVQPIFESKCNGCHNAEKSKGQLVLTDQASLLKGGKTGKLFVPGQPQVSLLLQRIHLPDGEKKHMPPNGKPQLTDDEMKVLYLWIKANADFEKKVISLPAGDSLRITASNFLKPAEIIEEKFDFAAADEKTIKKLNNNYRGVYSLGTESPALSVIVFNRSAYNPNVLTELLEIKKQVVSLDLHKMPVTDADLKTITKFENLRDLNLNYTDITGNTLKDLSSLKKLRSLSIAGTQLNPHTLDLINSFKSLTELTIWNTGLSAAEIQQLKLANKKIRVLDGYKNDGKLIPLNPPQIKNTQFVFATQTPLLISHPINGVIIRYTTDGTDPDSVHSAIYKPGVMISDNTTIKTRVYKPGWYGSNIVSALFYKNRYKPDSIQLLSTPNEKYQSSGAKTLTDGELGTTNYNGGKWLGYQIDMELLLYYNQPITPHTLTLNCLKMINSQIFLPTAIQVWGGKDKDHLKLMGTLKTDEQKKDDPVIITGVNCKLTTAAPVSCIKLVAKPIYKLPDWHPAKGKPSWIFADELFVN
jgi:uncharacterized membrane protein